MRYFLILTLAGLASCGTNSSGGEFNPAEGYQSRFGKEVYQQHCVQCHGPKGTMKAAGAKDLSVSKIDSKMIEDIIRNGKNGMPRQIQFIETEEELTGLIDYVKSLRK